MSASANVLSVQALEDLKSGLARFGGEADQVLRAAAVEIQRTLEWLNERHRYWQGEVRRRQSEYAAAKAALDSCLAAAAEDGRGGCGAYEARAAAALRQLRTAENELETVRRWGKAVQAAADDYGRQAQRLGTYLTADLPKANAVLSRKLDILHGYIGMSAPSPGIESSSATASSTASSSLPATAGAAAGVPAATPADAPDYPAASSVPTNAEEVWERVQEVHDAKTPAETVRIAELRAAGTIPPARPNQQPEVTPSDPIPERRATSLEDLQQHIEELKRQEGPRVQAQLEWIRAERAANPPPEIVYDPQPEQPASPPPRPSGNPEIGRMIEIEPNPEIKKG